MWSVKTGKLSPFHNSCSCPRFISQLVAFTFSHCAFKNFKVMNNNVCVMKFQCDEISTVLARAFSNIPTTMTTCNNNQVELKNTTKQIMCFLSDEQKLPNGLALTWGVTMDILLGM